LSTLSDHTTDLFPALSIRYSWKAFVAWGRSFFFSPFTLFTDPTNTTGSIVIYPVMFFFLAVSVFASISDPGL